MGGGGGGGGRGGRRGTENLEETGKRRDKREQKLSSLKNCKINIGPKYSLFFSSNGCCFEEVITGDDLSVQPYAQNYRIAQSKLKLKYRLTNDAIMAI